MHYGIPNLLKYFQKMVHFYKHLYDELIPDMILDPRSLIDVFFINININFFANASFHKDIYVNCMKTETCSLHLIVMHNRRQHSVFYIFLIILYFTIRKKVTCCNSIMQCNLNNSKICSVVYCRSKI